MSECLSLLRVLSKLQKLNLQPAGNILQRSEFPGCGRESMKSQQQAEYYKRAAEARRLAKETSDPVEKVDLFDVEQRWLSLARDTPDEEDLVR
jgi:hypothetical protein